MNFKNNHYGKYISMLYRQGSSFLSKKYNKFGIGSGQYMFMIHLYNNDGITQDELSENLLIDKGTTAKAIKKLEEANLVYRVKDEKDRRANRIYLTNTALNIKEEFITILYQWENQLTKGLSEDEVQAGLELLRKISNNIHFKED